MKFVPYKDEHFESCIDIFKSNQPKYFAPNELGDFAKWLKTGQMDKYFVIEDKDEIIGCGGVFIDEEKKEGGFAWGMIRHDLHGQGYGREFSLFRIELIQELCEYPVKLVTSQHTYPFYEKIGFVIDEIKKDGFQKGLDMYSMTLRN